MTNSIPAVAVGTDGDVELARNRSRTDAGEDADDSSESEEEVDPHDC